MNDPVLLPRPRHVELEEATCAVERRVHSIDDSLPPEGYRIAVSAHGVVDIKSADEAGRFYAEQTLRQLERNYGGGVPVGEIEDWPDLTVRAVMLDVSRDKVPKLDTLLALVDHLAEWKVNQIQLYFEHTFAYSEHEEVWRDASPYTAQDIDVIQSHCRDHHVELVPNQNCLGHMERWLQHDRYHHLALRPEGFELFGAHRGPSTLDPSKPEALELVRSLLAELLPNFASRRVNVGLDEPWELEGDRIDDYLDWVRQLRDSPELAGHEMLMWGDIVAGRSEVVAELPSDVTVCEWGYEADHPFDERVTLLANAQRRFWTCPGTSSWMTILGRWSNARTNIASAAEAGIGHGAEGLMVTDWGDFG